LNGIPWAPSQLWSKLTASARRSCIDEIKKQESRALARFDRDFESPDHLMPEALVLNLA